MFVSIISLSFILLLYIRVILSESSRSKPIWTCDDTRKKDLDEMLGRLRTAISGLLDIFQNISGPFFKNSKQVFQDILEIFKKCKEMEKLTKSSFFKEDEICDLMSEIKEELRKENTTKLAKHVASMYKFRNSPQYNEITGKIEKSKRKDDILSPIEEAANGDCELKTKTDKTEARMEKTESEKDHNAEGKKGTYENTGKDFGTAVRQIERDIETETLEGAVGIAGDTSNQKDTTEQKIKQALIDYGTHIEDPILQIIFDTSLHLAVAKSAEKQFEDTDAAGDSVKKSEDKETGKDDSRAGAEDRKPDKSVSEESVTDIVESAMISVCLGDHDSAEVAALKNSVKRKVEEIYSRALVDSEGTRTPQGVEAIHTGTINNADGEPVVDKSSQGQEADIAQSESQVKSQDTVEGEVEKKSETSNDKPEFPTNHRTLCIQICKALNKQLTCMQNELHKKWLRYKFGCDENATDFELGEAIENKLIESHDKHGRPLEWSDLPGSKNDTVADEAKTSAEKLQASKVAGESAQVLEDTGKPGKVEVESEDTEGATADMGNENGELEKSSG